MEITSLQFKNHRKTKRQGYSGLFSASILAPAWETRSKFPGAQHGCQASSCLYLLSCPRHTQMLQWRPSTNGPPTAEHFLREREVLSKVAGVGERKNISVLKAQAEKTREFETGCTKAAWLGSLASFSEHRIPGFSRRQPWIPNLSSRSKSLEVMALGLQRGLPTSSLLAPFVKMRQDG